MAHQLVFVTIKFIGELEMKKILIIVAYPNLSQSKVNKLWIEKLAKYPEQYTIHDLYEVYPSGEIDVEAEQRLVESHDHIVFQFPLYWFSAPPFLKKWQDLVLTYSWAYGSEGKALENKSLSLAVAAGIAEADYQPTGRYLYTIEEVLRPFEITVNYCNSNYLPPYLFYGTEGELTEAQLAESAENYHGYLQGILKRV